MGFSSLPHHLIKENFFIFRNYGLICKICVLMDSKFETKYGKRVVSDLELSIDKVSWIFRTSDWDEDGKPDNIGFQIKNVRVINKILLTNY